MDNFNSSSIDNSDNCGESVVSELTCEDLFEGKSVNENSFVKSKQIIEENEDITERKIYSYTCPHDIFPKCPLLNHSTNLDFNPITLWFYDEHTQRRFDKYFATQNSWTLSTVLVAIPIFLLISIYTWETTVYFYSNNSFSLENYFLIITIYALEGLLTLLYLKFLKDMNATFPLNKIVGINAVSSINSILRRNTHAKIACDDGNNNMKEINQMYETEMINQDAQDKEEQKSLVIKANRVLFSSSILGVFTIVFISTYTFVLMKFSKCTSMCIDDRIPSMEFLLMVILPSYLAISISICWRSLLACSIICDVLIVLLFFIYGGRGGVPEQLITADSIIEISYTSIFMCLLLWFQYRRYVLQFIHCESITGVIADIERKFAASNMLWMMPE